jgi:intraflagellar transport protein 46
MIKNNTHQYQENKYTKIHSVESAEKNPKKILEWINSVGDVHKSKQPPSVSYTQRMPDIDFLMQEWPAEVEEILSEINVPSEEIDLTLEEFCRVACNIIDIPVHRNGDNNIIESLHVMFTLFSAFKENQHFKQENESFAHAS